MILYFLAVFIYESLILVFLFVVLIIVEFGFRILFCLVFLIMLRVI